MLEVKTLDKQIIASGNEETKIVQSFKPSVLNYWLIFVILAFAVFLAFRAFGITTLTGLIILTISGILFIYIFLTVCTTKYIVTLHGILVKKFITSKKYREIDYPDIQSILIRQGKTQKLFRLGNITVNTRQVSHIFKGIKNPHKIKELINKEKLSEYERRTMLRKML